MSKSLEYPLSMFFQQLQWAWKNWHFRPEIEEEMWYERVKRFTTEIYEYLKEQAAINDGP